MIGYVKGSRIGRESARYNFVERAGLDCSNEVVYWLLPVDLRSRGFVGEDLRRIGLMEHANGGKDEDEVENGYCPEEPAPAYSLRYGPA